MCISAGLALVSTRYEDDLYQLYPTSFAQEWSISYISRQVQLHFSFSSYAWGGLFYPWGVKRQFAALGKEGKGKMVVRTCSKELFTILLLFAPGFDAFRGSRRYGGSYRWAQSSASFLSPLYFPLCFVNAFYTFNLAFAFSWHRSCGRNIRNAFTRLQARDYGIWPRFLWGAVEPSNCLGLGTPRI